MVNLSIIIVNYNVKQLLSECITSCLAATKNYVLEIIVIDNNSYDNSKEFILKNHPKTIWIQNNQNIGFSKACNQGAEIAAGTFLLFLNPDTLLPKDIFQKIIPFAQNTKNIGALGVRMVNKEDIFHPESKRNIPNPTNAFTKFFLNLFSPKIKNRGYYNVNLNEFDIGKTDILSGAFLLLPKAIFKKTGGFDPAYFMYGEDIDLSYTILNLGYQNYYYGATTILHYKGESTIKNKLYYKRFFHAMEIYIKKYHKKPAFIYLILLLGLKIRYYLSLFISLLK